MDMNLLEDRQMVFQRNFLIATNALFIFASLIFAYMWVDRIDMTVALEKDLSKETFKVDDFLKDNISLNETVKRLTKNAAHSKQTWDNTYRELKQQANNDLVNAKDHLAEKQKTLDAVQITVKTFEEQAEIQNALIRIQKEKINAIMLSFIELQKAYEAERKAHMRHHENDSPDDPTSILG